MWFNKYEVLFDSNSNSHNQEGQIIPYRVSWTVVAGHHSPRWLKPLLGSRQQQRQPLDFYLKWWYTQTAASRVESLSANFGMAVCFRYSETSTLHTALIIAQHTYSPKEYSERFCAMKIESLSIYIRKPSSLLMVTESCQLAGRLATANMSSWDPAGGSSPWHNSLLCRAGLQELYFYWATNPHLLYKATYCSIPSLPLSTFSQGQKQSKANCLKDFPTSMHDMHCMSFTKLHFTNTW